MRAGGFPGNPGGLVNVSILKTGTVKAGTGSTKPEAVDAAPGVRRSEAAGARMVPPGEGNEDRGGKDGEESELSHSTAEAGELSPRDPVEGRGHRQVAPVGGKARPTHLRLGPVSTSRQRIAELARQALKDGGGHRLASWTSGYATSRSEAICRGAGCGRTRTSGSVGGQGQQRPWSTRPRVTGAHVVVGPDDRDTPSDVTLDVRAWVVLNCAGPWAPRLLATLAPQAAGSLSTRLSKAMNLVTKRPLPQTHAVGGGWPSALYRALAGSRHCRHKPRPVRGSRK